MNAVEVIKINKNGVAAVLEGFVDEEGMVNGNIQTRRRWRGWTSMV